MDVTFGVQARDGTIKVQIGDGDVDDFKKRLDEAFKNGGNELFWVTDKDGREIGIPTDKVAFVEFGAEKAARHVGFSAAS